MELQTPDTLDANQAALEQKKCLFEAQLRSGVSWFYWIGGLSIVNTISYLLGSSTTFIIGLGLTQYIDVLAKDLAEGSIGGGTILQVVGICIDVAIAGTFAIAGFLGQKRSRWAVITGMVFYVVDAVILLLFQAWMAVAFHALALVGLFRAQRALKKLKGLETAVSPYSIPVISGLDHQPWYQSWWVKLIVSMAFAFMGIMEILVIVLCFVL